MQIDQGPCGKFGLNGGGRWRRPAVSAAIGLAFALATAQAAVVQRVTPQGEVAQLRQFQVSFDRAVVPLGDADHAPPYRIQCEGDAPRATGRWLGDRTWTHTFETDVPPGVRCVAEPSPGWQPSVAGAGTWQGRPVRFQTGGRRWCGSRLRVETSTKTRPSCCDSTAGSTSLRCSPTRAARCRASVSASRFACWVATPARRCCVSSMCPPSRPTARCCWLASARCLRAHACAWCGDRASHRRRRRPSR